MEQDIIWILYYRIWTEYRGVFRTLSKMTTQKMKFSIKDFFSQCDQIRRFLPAVGCRKCFEQPAELQNWQ